MVSVIDKHLFAFYVHKDSFLGNQEWLIGATICCKQHDLWHRITNVLRFSPGQQYELFDQEHVYTFQFVKSSKPSLAAVWGALISLKKIVKQAPSLHLYVGLTKREAFGDLLFTAGQFGVDEIVPLVSEKIHRNWWSEKEQVRAQEQIIAGAEQAKSYSVGRIKAPISSREAFAHEDLSNSLFIVLEASGKHSLYAYLQSNKSLGSYKKIGLLVGPEGGFTSKELLSFEELATPSCCQMLTLTQAILRTQDAVLLALGMLRAAIF